MNIPILIVACFTLFAVFAHVIGGTKETASITPNGSNEKLTRAWKQSMCAFQMLAIDLLLVTVALFTLALTDIIPFKHEITLLLSLLYFLWGIVWLVQLFWLKSKRQTYFYLPQWLFWFIGAGLLYYGAQIA